MLDIVSVQRGNILDWFLSDALSFSASAHSCGRMERSSSEILPTHKTSLFHCCAIKKIHLGLQQSGGLEVVYMRTKFQIITQCDVADRVEWA